ncbi:MAG: glycosyltransferase family 39 protein, partial [Rivularia sp. ALOHA_DT_140]|nr:glycosyltransferase family 39 protein [Rivularia sp. ALOHA_DT_140]
LELLQPLDYDQGAPFGFLIVEKLANQLFGNNEYALRLFPLLSAIISFLLFYQLAKRFLRGYAIPIALAFFTTLNRLVFYATELKQYSSDIAFTLLSCLLVMEMFRKKLNITRIILFSLLGGLTIWFSHPAIFVLTGFGASYLLINASKTRKNQVFKILIIYSSWLVSFAVFYFVSVQSLNNNQDLMTSWSNAFPSSVFDIIWLFDAFGKFFYDPLGFKGITDGVAIFAFVIGCISLFNRQKERLVILLFPLFATFFAAYLQKYPFRGRLVLFLTPFFILLIAEGIHSLIRQTRSKPAVIGGILLGAWLLFQPITKASNLLVTPNWEEEIKPVISYVKSNQQPSDILYIFQRGHYQFLYYAEKYGYQEGDYIIGVDDLDKYDGRDLSDKERKRYENDLNKLRGNKRVWLIFSHAHIGSENEMMKSYLDKIGKQIDYFQSPGAFVYLYDLS